MLRKPRSQFTKISGRILSAKKRLAFDGVYSNFPCHNSSLKQLLHPEYLKQNAGGMCFGPGCSGQIFFNGTAMVIRVV